MQELVEGFMRGKCAAKNGHAAVRVPLRWDAPNVGAGCPTQENVHQENGLILNPEQVEV